MKEIILSNGMVAQVDDEDFERVNRHNWYAWTCPKSGAVYAYGHIKGKRGAVTMHSFIMDAPPGMIAHHVKDEETLNNQRFNLRLLTRQEHAQMHSVGFRTNTSGFTGVSKLSNGKFRAHIKYNRVYLHLGHFFSAEEAAMARDFKAIELGYPVQGLNFQQLSEVVLW